MIPRKHALFLWFVLVSSSDARPSFGSNRPFLSNAVQVISRRGRSALTQSVPALSIYNVRDGDTSLETLEVAVKKKKKSRRKIRLPSVDGVSNQLGKGGFYYGITSKTLSKVSKSEAEKRPSLSDSMLETLEELKLLRQEMETMRKEMQTLKRKMIDDGEIDEDGEAPSKDSKAKRRRQKEYEKLAKEIESWAHKMLKETEDDGWKEVNCNKMMRKSLNPDEKTTAFIKWMKDSRGENADKDDETEYPCIKCFATIDAPLEDVCTYLSQEASSPEYNDLVVKYKDVEDISPNAKICWSQSPQILFIKPRDFVTFCHHRWTKDGSEIILNQACEHPDYPATREEKEGKACRAYALRGANFLSRCPDDPDKTSIALIAHANPGGGVPKWAAKTAVNALAPIEPFKLFQKINTCVQRNQPQLRQRLQEAEMVSSLPGGRSPRPAGMAQLGYACFWPNGGGIKEGGVKPSSLHANSGELEEGGVVAGQNDPAENPVESNTAEDSTRIEDSEMSPPDIQEGSS